MIEKQTEICCECGDSVAAGSGKYVNRVPELNDYVARVEMGREYPDGDFVCAECDDMNEPSEIEQAVAMVTHDNKLQDERDKAIRLLVNLLCNSNIENEYDQEIGEFLQSIGELPKDYVPYW